MKYRATIWVSMAALLGLGLLTTAGGRGWAAERAAAESRLLGDLKYLAGDECEGRGTTTRGINLAADHIARQFQKAGLQPAGKDKSWFQPFPHGSTAQQGQGNQIILHGPQGQSIELDLGKHFQVVGMGGSGKVEAPVVFAGYGITAKEGYDDYANLDVAGKVVILLRRAPRFGNEPASGFTSNMTTQYAALQRKASTAVSRKAAAVLFVNDRGQAAEANDALMDFDYTSSSRDTVNIPMAHLRRSLVAQMVLSATGGRTLDEIERDIDRSFEPQSLTLTGWRCRIATALQRRTVEVKNVVGVLEGKGPLAKETIVIGAHYDHLGLGRFGSLAPGKPAIHYGADDNGSGTVALLELARRFGEMPDRHGRRLVFIAFTAEEVGLVGSAHYCKSPLFPLESTAAMVNMDMVGRLRDDKLIVYGTGTAKTFERLIDDLNQKHGFKLSKMAAGLGPSDHSSFYQKQIPVFHFFTGLHSQYHRPTDTVATINVEGIRRIADMVEEVVQHLAAVESRPEYVKVTARASPRDFADPPRLGIVPDANNDREGVLVGGVADGSPAAKVGVKRGDRLIEIAGKPVKDQAAYLAILRGLQKGNKVEVTVMRDGKPLKLTVTLE